MSAKSGHSVKYTVPICYVSYLTTHQKKFNIYNACQKSWNTCTILTPVEAEKAPSHTNKHTNTQCWFSMVWNTSRGPAMHLIKAQTVHEQNNIVLGEGWYSVTPSKKGKRSRIFSKTTGVFQGLLAGIAYLFFFVYWTKWNNFQLNLNMHGRAFNENKKKYSKLQVRSANTYANKSW